MKDKKIWKYFVLGVFVIIVGVFYYKNNVKDTTKEATALFLEKSNTDDNAILAQKLTNEGNESEPQKTDEETDVKAKDEIMYIHVCGAVIHPGVYELTMGSRVIDAVTLAGGFMEDAAMDAINQAQKLADGVRLYIPTLEDIENTNTMQDEYPVITLSPNNVSSSENEPLDRRFDKPPMHNRLSATC